MLNSLDFMFTASGYQVFAFRCAEHAAASPDIAKVDCLVVDYALPDGDGLTLIRELRRRGVNSPAILIASVPSAPCKKQASEDGVPLMEKPLIADHLATWVDQVTAKA